MADLQRIADDLSQLTVMEAAELSRMLEAKWGVSAAAPVVQTVAPTPQEVAPVEQQAEFDVILAGIDPNKKINVIKEIRSITGLGLKEAKEFTEGFGPNKVAKEAVSKDEAESIKRRLEEAGATVQVR